MVITLIFIFEAVRKGFIKATATEAFSKITKKAVFMSVIKAISMATKKAAIKAVIKMAFTMAVPISEIIAL